MHDIRAMKRQHKLLRFTDRKKVLLSGDVYSGLPPDDDVDKSIYLASNSTKNEPTGIRL